MNATLTKPNPMTAGLDPVMCDDDLHSRDMRSVIGMVKALHIELGEAIINKDEKLVSRVYRGMSDMLQNLEEQ